MEVTKRRLSKPWIVQRFWDAILFNKDQKQVPKFERVYGYLRRRYDFNKSYCERHLRDAVKDGLIHVIRKTGYKGSKIGEEQESFRLPVEQPERTVHDWYCFECHDSGDVLCCSSCFRVYHPRCLKDDSKQAVKSSGKLVCPTCKLLQTPNTLKLKKDELNTLLGYTCKRLKEKPVAEMQHFPITEADEWRTPFLICNPMNLNIMEEKTQKMKYTRVEEFQADAEHLCHNVAVYYGSDSPITTHAKLMLEDCDYDIGEIRLCHDCYRMSNEKINKFWFCQPCNPPHELVYAKVKGFQFWPAKVIRKDDDIYDVRFFGAFHERAKVEVKNIKPITCDDAVLGIKRCVSWDKACEELNIHQERLKPTPKGTRAAASRNNHSNELSNGDSDQSKSKQSTPKVKKKVEVSDSDLNMSSSGNEKPGNDSNEPRRYKSLRLIMKQLKENEETEKLGADTQLSKALKRNKKHIGVREKHVKKNEASKTRRQMVHCHTKSELAVSKELKKLTKLIDENFETDNNDIDNSYTFSFKGNGRILENTNMLNPVGKHQPNNVSKELPTKPITRRTKELLHIDSGQPLPKKARMDNEENVDVNVHAYLSGTVVPRGSVTVSILKPLPVRFNNVQNSAKLDLDLQNKLGNHHAKNCAEVKQDEVHTLRNNVQNNDTRTSTGDAEPLLEYSVNNICSVSEALKKSNNSMPIVESHPSSQLSQNSDEESATRCGILGKQTENRDSETALQQLSVDLVRICNKDTNFNQIKFKVCSNDQDRSFVIVTSSEASTNHENDKNSVKECTSSCETVVENKNSFLNEKSPSKESDISVSMSNLHTSQEMLNQNIMVPEGGVCVESANNDLKIPVNERIDVECASVGLGDVLMEDRPQYREVQMEKGSFAREPLEGTKKQERTVLTGIVEDKVAHTVDETCVDKGAMDFFGNSQMEDNTFSLETQLRADCIDNVNPGITSLCSNHNEDTTVMDPIAKKLTMNLRTKSLREKPSKNVKRLESDCETSTSAEILISSSAKLVRQSHPAQEDHNVVSSSSQETTYSCASIGTQTYRWSCRTLSKYIQTDPERFSSSRTEAKANAKAIKEMKEKLDAEFKASKERLIKDMTLKLERKHNEEKERAVEAAVENLQKCVIDMRDELQKFREFHEAELKSLKEKHLQQISEVKKKQWCYNCESEAIYHCCWNTSYCSTDCQQVHWQKEHKRNCRRKR